MAQKSSKKRGERRRQFLKKNVWKKKRERKIRKKQRKATEKQLITPLHFRAIKIKVIGIGGGGSSIVSEIAPKLKRIKFLVANTDRQAIITANRAAERFQFGQEITKGLGTGMNPELAETAALNEKERIKRVFQGQDLSILVSTLGGGVGSGASPVFAKAARGAKNLTLGIFTLPFEFEGKKRKEIAETALEKLKPDLNAFSIIPNDRIFQIIDPKTPLKEALSAMNKVLAENIQGLIEMIYLPGLINIDFADLRAALEGKGRLSYLATAEVQGDNRSDVGLKKVLQSPLYEYGIQGAERILFNISGSKNLTITEVEKISKTISDFNLRAKIIFGLSQRDSYQNRIKITLLAVGCGDKIKKAKRKKRKKVGSEIKEIKKIEKKESRKISPKKEVTTKKKPLKNKLANLDDKRSEEKKEDVRISRTALDLKKDLDRAEKEILSQEEEWDLPAFLRAKSSRLK
jgi:cell division protein FtsZ